MEHQAAPAQGDPNYADYVIQLATGGMIRKGVLNEPRMIFDEIDQSAVVGAVAAGNEGVFINGEQFPIRLTRMVACVRDTNQAGVFDDARNIQRIGLRLIFHNQYYMNPDFLPLPVWGNTNVAGGPAYSASTSHWSFIENGQPFVLSARDTLVITLQLIRTPISLSTVPVNVTFTGIGALSRRPYLFNGQVNLENVTETDMSTVDFRNDGSEPVIITDMTVNVGNDSDGVDPQGDIGRVRINIRQVGNGTGARWFSGPQTPLTLDLAQATLLGVTTGRAVVHEFPGDGYLWEPGEGLTVETAAINPPGGFDSVLCLGMVGYLMVT